MDSLNLKSLIEVVRTGSFSKAAENLYVTQSAMSRRIKCLEEEYGCPLVDRCGTTIKATPAGRLVMGEARKILSIEESLLRRLDEMEEDPSIAFACTHPFGISHLPKVLQRYMTRYRLLNNFMITFDMPHRALQGLQDGIYDLIVIEHWELQDVSDFAAATLPEDEMIFVSSPRLGLDGPVVRIDDLLRHRLYRRQKECCSWRYLTLSMQLAGRDVSEFTNTVVYDDLHVIVESLIAGDGIALISRDLVEKLVAEGKLCSHRVEGFNHRRMRTLLMRRDVPLSPAAEFLVSSVFAAFDQEVHDLEAVFH
ncbi:LysR family transcriptional regulator [Geomonas sp.]|uniref:LysR family transcriptional regulator n=1 Tax=Geomonas sp. TaxID=2651584 RepID=UPI002B49E17E|nr:LysR family transcriptional regulator [Geomonas sp.]HJV36657.1 LysR family transcriptional regulator [Geomonas sp.]